VVGNEVSQPSKVVMQVLRYALTGLEPGVGVPVVIEILGKGTVIKRLENCRPARQSRDGPDTHSGDI
jgi:Anticodon binding domain